VPVTTDALVGAHDPLRRRRPLAACTSATARRRARLHVGWTCLAPVAESRCGCTPGSTMHGMPDPRLRTRWRSSTRTGVRRRDRLVRDGIGWRLTPRARTRPGPARTSPPGACAPEC
jgi:hypothetical protein